ncbi:hypothetical protein TNCV_2979481 [Trichonephila clavipes]|nr:hypothetical protein TNCV_2979481 [Trichonephila clavipes]
MTIHRRLIEQHLSSYQPLRHLPLMPAQCRVRLLWYWARSDLNHADWGYIVFSDESHVLTMMTCVLTIIEDVSGDAQSSVPILLSLLNAPQVLNQMLWSGAPFQAGLLWSSLKATCSTAVRRRHSENCFATVPFAVPWPCFSAR